jgi:hypothetical protein
MVLRMIQCNIWLWNYEGLNLDFKCMKIQQVLLFTNQSPIGCEILFLIFIILFFLSLHNWYKLDLGKSTISKIIWIIIIIVF